MKFFEKKNITIPTKALIPIVFLMPLVGIILSKRNAGGLVLLIVGVGAGICIGRGFWKK